MANESLEIIVSKTTDDEKLINVFHRLSYSDLTNAVLAVEIIKDALKKLVIEISNKTDVSDEQIGKHKETIDDFADKFAEGLSNIERVHYKLDESVIYSTIKE